MLEGGTGTLIAFEGTDGAGKSTATARLRESLEAQGIETLLVTKWVHEIPANDGLADHARRLNKLIYGRPRAVSAALGERHWFYALAAWYHLVDDHIIRPALKDGITVISDNSHFKTVARYAVGGDLSARFCLEALSGLTPADHTFFLDIAPKIALERKGKFSTVEAGRTGNTVEHFLGYQNAVAEELRAMSYKRGWTRLDTGRLDREATVQFIVEHLRARRTLNAR